MKISPQVLVTVAMVALSAGSAFAQGVNLLPSDRQRSSEDREKDRQIEREYKAEMKKIPDQKASSDPWGNVRSSDTPAKPAPARKPKQN
jgi:hypothetical protein